MIKPHTEINGIFSSEDWVPTLVAAAGEPDMTQQAPARATTPAARPSRSISTATTSTSLLAGGPTKRQEFFYWTDDGDLAGLRYDQWKVVFLEQQA